MDIKRIGQIIILILLVGLAVWLWPKMKPSDSDVEIVDFTSCEQAGGTLIDGEPVKCIAPDGREFEEAEHAEPDVVLEQPKYGDLITSPLQVMGKARGTWFFEANLPVTLKDQDGNVLIKKGFMTSDDWMTTDYVNFTGTLEFDPGDAEFGVLIIEKDNPSGLPELDSSFAIPVRFK